MLYGSHLGLLVGWRWPWRVKGLESTLKGLERRLEGLKRGGGVAMERLGGGWR